MADFDGASHQRLVVDTASFSARLSANQGFVHLHMVPGLPANPVLVGPHHARAELVENPKCRFVAFQAKLPLELDGRYAGGLTGNQIGAPEPCAQRYVAAFHDRPGRQSHLAAAFTAGQDSWPRCNAERFSGFLTMGTGEAVASAGSFQIGSTRPVIGKKPLKLRKRLRKWQVIAVEDVHRALSISCTIYPWWVCASNG